MTSIVRLRSSILFPAAATVIGGMLIGLASLTYYAFEKRQDMAVAGKILGIAHEIEKRLRDSGKPTAVLEAVLSENRLAVTSLRIEDRFGEEILEEAGKPGPGDEVWRGRIFPGPHGPPGPPESPGLGSWGPRQRGMRILQVTYPAELGKPPLPIRLLLILSVFAAFFLIAFARLAGRSIERRYREVLQNAEARRFEVLGRAGAGLAHQLRTPLATIKGNCQLLAETLPNDGPRPYVQRAIEQAERMETMLGRLLDFARPPSPERRQITPPEIAAIVRDIDEGIRVVLPDSGDRLFFHADPEHLHQILDVLLSNARAVSDKNKEIEVRIGTSPSGPEITVADRGPGPGDNPEELFEPYVSMRPEGIGLGLSIARALAEANRIRLRLERREGGGCTAILSFHQER